MIEASAKLALSILPHSYALTVAQCNRALQQCKDQGNDMLMKACTAVEKVSCFRYRAMKLLHGADYVFYFLFFLNFTKCME